VSAPGERRRDDPQDLADDTTRHRRAHGRNSAISTPTIAEIDRNIYLGRTGATERPYADDPVRRYADPADLARHQTMWDQAESWRADNQRQQDERNAEVETTRLAEIEKRRTNARADLERELERRFLLNPAATPADWEAVRDQAIREALMAAADPIAEARAALLKSGGFPRF